ncbi:MAG: hypothetical protein UT14_C0053G0014 [Candidatus Shapirobacteria bacterium GW2011_GWE1_38_92]|uniref:O-antigen ligase-related domain-containing protein n=1 Tax=Candidatus Shapirobacteria bacterium GW2011_GWE1_38_92 TaxID=1618489 RepID=A0A0G0PKC2_9BACT|nr:MAG: hypothetical protein UT14_C0053G0014 [Candidatus Shapirobacteria bacterium GW2011_GWE1_38_92]
MVERLEKIFLIGFLVTIPTQLGLHFWPEWSKVAGIRVDYLSPVLYLTDIFWTGWVVLKIRKGLEFKWGWRGWMALILIGLNILAAVNRCEAVYRWLRWGQWGLTVWWMAADGEIIKKYLTKIIPIWITVETFLAVSQMWLGRSAGGIWYWLGERTFNLNTLGIAQMSFDDRLMLRGYGTFSHPNSLAGFLIVSWWLWEMLKGSKKNRLVVIMTGLGVAVSGSRLGWVILGVLWIYKILKGRPLGVLYKRIGLGLVLMGIGGWDSESWEKRVRLSQEAAEMIEDNLWLGVGEGNFLVRLSEYSLDTNLWRQPVHNVPLLLVAELGILGCLGWLNLGWSKIKKIKLKKTDWILVGIVAVTGMFDHYWVTLPQNWWLLAIVIGFLIFK